MTMIGFLLKLAILISLIGWIASGWVRKYLGSGLKGFSLLKNSSGPAAEEDDLATVREFLARRDGSAGTIGIPDFYAKRSELPLEESVGQSFLKDSLHLWVFASLVIPWLIYYFGFLGYMYWHGANAVGYIGATMLTGFCCLPLVATAMLPFAYDSPRDYSLKDLFLLVLCGALAASFVSSVAENPGSHDAELRRFLLVWPVYQVTLSLFGILHWLKKKVF